MSIVLVDVPKRDKCGLDIPKANRALVRNNFFPAFMPLLGAENAKVTSDAR